MHCFVYSAESVLNMPPVADYIATYMTKPNSEFRKKLLDRNFTGSIAIVSNDGGPIGWARTEQWRDEFGGYWDTLEAFVDEKHRGEGVASFAASGLFVAKVIGYSSPIAVFDPRMLIVARNARMFPTLFSKEGDKWVKQ